MNTRKIAAEYRLSHWSQIIQARKESGMTIKAYCEKAGFHENIFFYWQRKLRETACEQFTDISNGTTTSKALKGFAEVKLVTSSDAPHPTVIPKKHGEIRVDINGIQITADSEYPPSMLAALLKGLVTTC
jgi:transposase-like protein